jgi:hypothetical protein
MQSEDESGSTLCRSGDEGGEFCSLHSDPGRATELGRKVSTSTVCGQRFLPNLGSVRRN